MILILLEEIVSLSFLIIWYQVGTGLYLDSNTDQILLFFKINVFAATSHEL